MSIPSAPPHVPEPEAQTSPDQVPFGPDLRAAELAFVRDALRDSYAHLEAKQQQWGVDLDQLFSHYEPEIRAADTWSKYEQVMVAFVSEMHDAHVAWRRKRGKSESKRHLVRIGIDSRFVGSALYVTNVWQGSPADVAGLAVGDQIVSIDGIGVDKRVAGLADLRSWSRLEAARYDFAQQWPASRIPADQATKERVLGRARPDGSVELVHVPADATKRPGGKGANVELEPRGPVFVLHVRDLDGLNKKFVALIEPLLDQITASPHGLVVDLRGDDGGFENNAQSIATRVVAKPTVGGAMRVKLSERARATHAQWKNLAGDPQRPGWSVEQKLEVQGKAAKPYAGKIAAIIDEGCRSSCESLALLLHAAGARLIGQQTGGASGAPITFTLPHSNATVTIPARAMFDLAGTPLEGRGVIPDEVVDYTLADITARRDPQLAAGLAYVCEHKGACL